MKNNSGQLGILRDNIQFGLNKSKETKASLRRKTGVTRSTIYKNWMKKWKGCRPRLLNVLLTSLVRPAILFNNESLEDLLTKAPVVSVYGNKNPIAVSILSEMAFLTKSEC